MPWRRLSAPAQSLRTAGTGTGTLIAKAILQPSLSLSLPIFLYKHCPFGWDIRHRLWCPSVWLPHSIAIDPPGAAATDPELPGGRVSSVFGGLGPALLHAFHAGSDMDTSGETSGTPKIAFFWVGEPLNVPPRKGSLRVSGRDFEKGAEQARSNALTVRRTSSFDSLAVH